MKYKIWDCLNKEYLDLQKYCVNGFGDVMTCKGLVLQGQADFKIIEEKVRKEKEKPLKHLTKLMHGRK